MFKLILSDFERISKDLKHWILVLLMAFGITALISFGMILTGSTTSSKYLEGFTGSSIISGIAVGVFELSTVFGADQKAKIYPALIGSGLPRWKVITAKFLIFAILSLIDLLLMGAAGYMIADLYQISLGGIYTLRFVRFLVMVWLFIITACVPAALVFFLTDKVILMLGVYIPLMVGLATQALNTVGNSLGINLLPILDVRYHAVRCISFIAGGAFNLISILYVVVYMTVLLLVTAKVFENKELNF